MWEIGYLQEQKSLNDSFITKTHPSVSDSSQELGGRDSGHSLLAATQVGNVSLGQLCGLNLFQASWHPYPLCTFEKGRNWGFWSVSETF